MGQIMRFQEILRTLAIGDESSASDKAGPGLLRGLGIGSF
jgi:hypothetical protein